MQIFNIVCRVALNLHILHIARKHTYILTSNCIYKVSQVYMCVCVSLAISFRNFAQTGVLYTHTHTQAIEFHQPQS